MRDEHRFSAKRVRQAVTDLRADPEQLRAALGLAYGYLLGRGEEVMAAAVGVTILNTYPDAPVDGLLGLCAMEADG